MTGLHLPSGLRIEHPTGVLDAFVAAEWPYYDGIADDHPMRITPIDVLAPVAVNAYAFRGGAANLRQVHLGLAAACDPVLPDILANADLCTEGHLSAVKTLLHGAIQVPQVLLPVATKVLFRKRRALIPMLDNVVLAYYFEALGRPELASRSQDKTKAAEVAVVVLEAFRTDLARLRTVLEEMVIPFHDVRRPIGPLRAREVLIWCQVEPRGYYRTATDTK